MFLFVKKEKTKKNYLNQFVFGQFLLTKICNFIEILIFWFFYDKKCKITKFHRRLEEEEEEEKLGENKDIFYFDFNEWKETKFYLNFYGLVFCFSTIYDYLNEICLLYF